MFSTAPVRSLHVLGSPLDDGPASDEIVNQWQQTLHCFPLLECLEIEYTYASKAIFMALGSSTAFGSDTNVVVCPRLESIRVGFWAFSQYSAFDAMVSALEYRASRGSRLETFEVNDDGVEPVFRRKFGDLVDNLSFS
ncbi:hypothetical protein A0H81_06778 [Grifola frondosa]|uniref:Uncharacterized protein n=1 Tax=Grifola frondosa TaxID=5627 RepID=A0A1C7M8P0_GRIFR|nr:hypothetical protein A0H81_06778 [Grifola frondosa]